MKRIYILSLLLFISANIFSQDSLLLSKKGIPILPQTNDWAIGIDAVPFTNIFNQYSSMQFDFVHGTTLMGKKFINPTTAHRVKLRLNFTSYQEDNFIIEDGQEIPDPLVTVTDSRIMNFTNITIGYGLEKRMGYGRLQALYGGEVLYGLGTHTRSYTYGNDFSMTNPNPSTTNFGNNIPGIGRRVNFMEDGIEHYIGLRAFLGVEYFILPKVSVGGEFGWGFGYTFEGVGKQVVQYWDPSENAAAEDVDESAGNRSYNIDNDNFHGAIFFMFHFQ